MNRTTYSPLRLLIKTLYFLLPGPIAWLSLSLMSMHAKYYGMGINMAANNGELFFLVAPVLLVALYATAAASLLLANRYSNSQWLGFSVGSALMLSLGIGIFLAQARFRPYYSIDPPKSMASFLEYYLHEMSERISTSGKNTPQPSRAAPGQ